MTKRLTSALLLLAALCFGQDGQQVNISQSPPYKAYSTITYYTGTNATITCQAPSWISPNKATQTVTVSTVSNANPGSFTATAHGFGDYASHGATITPVVIITGATGGWTGINGVWKATVTSANAFTIPVDTSGFGSFSGQSITVKTTAPRWNTAVWSIFQQFYDGSNNAITLAYASSPAGAGSTTEVGGTPAQTLTCSLRATLSYQ